MLRRRKAQQTGTRRSGREFAFRVLFEAQQGQMPWAEAYERAYSAILDPNDDAYPVLSGETLAFSKELLNGYGDRHVLIDEVLRQVLQGWTFGQMAKTDLNILRLALYERLFVDIEAGIVNQSATRIARKFGGDESGRFVNGVLGALSKTTPAEWLRLAQAALEASAAEARAAAEAAQLINQASQAGEATLNSPETILEPQEEEL